LFLLSTLVPTPDQRHLLVLQPAEVVALDVSTAQPVSRVPLDGAFLGLAVHPKGDRVFVAAGAQVQELRLRDGRLQPSRQFPLPKTELAGDLTLSPDARFLYVANPLNNTLTVLNALTGFVVSEIATGRRPCRVVFAPDGRTFFVSHVADGNIGQYNSADGARLASIPVGPHPSDLVLLPGKHENYIGRLFVACSNTNSVVVLGLTESNTLRLIGRVTVAPHEYAPLGSTPAALAPSPDGKRLYVAASDNHSLAVLDIDNYEAELAGFLPTVRYPVAVRAVGQKLFVAGSSVAAITAPPDEDLKPPPDLPPPRDWNPPPIRHVLYILTGGSTPKAAGFQRLEPFQPAAETEAEGYQWSTAAIASHWVRKLGLRFPDLFRTFEPAAFPPAGYLWTNALAAGLTIRNWGLARGPDPALDRHTRLADTFVGEFLEMARANTLPQLALARLDGPGAEAVLNRLAESLPKTPAWSRLVVLVAPEFGPPAAALLLSPYAKPGCGGQTGYNTLSVLRTIELILGLQPMTQHDAAALPLSACF
jgi:YVTN family beta-propeller protein